MLRCFVFWCIAAQVTLTLAQHCSILFPKENDRNQPIVLIDGKLTIPSKGAVSLKTGELLELYCPHARNKLEQGKGNLTTATCIERETFAIANKKYDFSQLQCTTPAKGSAVVTDSKCGNNQGHKINIGFNVRNDWITLIQVCYHGNEGNALYAEHTLYGQAIKSATGQTYRPSFQDNGVGQGLRVNTNYKQASQKKIFAELLGSTKVAERYLQKSFLARGHLAPDADFLYSGLQFSTYFYVNTCPQWDVVNGGNWLGIERMVRKFAASFGKPLKIITGSHGVLTLPDVNNNLQEMYLDKSGKLPVPKFLWKIVYDGTTKAGIAFVALNDPFIERLTREDLLCPDVCEGYGWGSNRFSNIKKGFVYCCDVNNLRKAVPTIPKLTIKGILRN